VDAPPYHPASSSGEQVAAEVFYDEDEQAANHLTKAWQCCIFKNNKNIILKVTTGEP